MLKNILLKSHFFLLGIVILNFLLRIFFEFGLTYQIDTILKALIVMTGVALFLLHFKPFKIINLYLAVYPIALGMLLIAYVIRGMLGGIIMMIILSPFHLNEVEYKKGDITIYNSEEGFMYRCCSYKVTIKEHLIFERKLAKIKNSIPIDFNEKSVETIPDGIKLTFEEEVYDEDKDEFELKIKTLEIKE